MSQNLVAAIEQEDHENTVRPMILVRFMSGITGTAQVCQGDVIDFNGLNCTIGQTHHRYAMGDISPVSQVYGSFHRPLADFEIERLALFGFRDLKSGD